MRDPALTKQVDPLRLMTHPPEPLASARLALRPVGAHDAAALHRHWTDPCVRRYLWDDVVVSREQVEDLIRESEHLFARHGYGLWAIRVEGSGDLGGCGGYWTFHTPPRLELVLSLSPAHWGRGLAAEAGRRLIEHAFGRLGFDEVQASTDAPNAASRRLIDRLGFRSTHRTGEGGTETVFYSLPRAAHEAADSNRS